MPIKRSYADLGDACRAARALDLVGDRWTLVIVRELMFEPRSFSDLIGDVRGITPAVLTSRLRMLQDVGVVQRAVTDSGAESASYTLTSWGRGLEVILQELGRWEARGAIDSRPGGMTPNAVIVAMRTMAPSIDSRIRAVNLRLRDERRAPSSVHDYTMSADAGALRVISGYDSSASATVIADSTAWSEVIFQGVPLTAVQESGHLNIEGESLAVEQLIEIFSSSQ